MPTLTLNEIKTEHTRLAQLIEAFEKASQQRLLLISGVEIALDEGEHYSGAVLNEDGSVKHHLVLLAEKPDTKLTWKDALAWASLLGASLPDRQEAALLYANCKPHLEACWHWTSEAYAENESCAWVQSFGDGSQDYLLKVNVCAVRAVRRVNG